MGKFVPPYAVQALCLGVYLDASPADPGAQVRLLALAPCYSVCVCERVLQHDVNARVLRTQSLFVQGPLWLPRILELLLGTRARPVVDPYHCETPSARARHCSIPNKPDKDKRAI